ncbi:MAG: Peptide chain release factor [Labilithrix sp.]|nr:Peptide chain release factor [Labilithrix sp.]
MKRATFGFLAAALLLSAARTANADQATPPPTLPSETLKGTAATTGKTEVAKSGFATGALPAADDPKQATEMSIGAGGLFSSGNARTVALTSLLKLKVRRDQHQLGVQAAANFARAGTKDAPVDTTVENYQGVIRYDYFITDAIAAFGQVSARHDRFQGLDLRLNFDPGLAYYFINTKKQSLRVEGGYDLQHDVRRNASRVPTPPEVPEGQPAPAPLPLLDKTETLHNIRLFAGYENKLYKEVSVIGGLEYLQNVSDLGTYRLVFDIGIKSNISDNLAIATTYTMRYENEPLPGVQTTDSMASINLVYTLF